MWLELPKLANRAYLSILGTVHCRTFNATIVSPTKLSYYVSSVLRVPYTGQLNLYQLVMLLQSRISDEGISTYSGQVRSPAAGQLQPWVPIISILPDMELQSYSGQCISGHVNLLISVLVIYHSSSTWSPTQGMWHQCSSAYMLSVCTTDDIKTSVELTLAHMPDNWYRNGNQGMPRWFLDMLNFQLQGIYKFSSSGNLTVAFRDVLWTGKIRFWAK